MPQSEIAQCWSSIQAVVFDLDDTLYPEVGYVHSGFRAVSRQMAQLEPNLQAQQVYEMLLQAFETGPRDSVFNAVLDKLGQRNDDQIIAELLSLYRCHRPILKLKLAVREMLNHLQGRFKLGLITDGRLPAQRLKVEALGIKNAFDHIIYTEQLGREHWKPSAKGFECMAQALGIAHEFCVYVGDNPGKDFIAPNHLGWLTIQIKSPGQVHADIETAPGGAPKIILQNVTEILSITTPDRKGAG